MTGRLHMCINRNEHHVVGIASMHANGTYVHTADGQWRHWGADDASLTSLAVDPANSRTVFTSGQNGVWRSHDDGDTWRIMNDWRITDARAVALDPHRPGHLYVALSDGIAFSQDHGDTWERREMGLVPHGHYTQTVVVDRERPEHVVAACERGLFVSTDAGRAWWLRVPTTTTFTQVVQSVHEPSTWFATNESAGLWRSRDSAESWHKLDLLVPLGTLFDVAVCPSDPGLVAVVDYDHGLWLSLDHGDTWERRSTGLPSPARAHRLGIEPSSGRFILATYRAGLHVSDDRGLTWNDGGMAGSEVRSFVVVGAGS